MTGGDTQADSELDEGNGETRLPGLRQLIGAVIVGLALILTGTALGTWVTTGGGEITIEETTIETESGLDLQATVHEPPEASPDEPAPVVTLIHGYTGEQGTMASFARELADRGYVAVTVDQPGHGASDPPAFVDGWGGPATLEFARSLDTTDEDRVAMVGHSMGGFASLAAAEEQPDGYDSVVLLGSTWGTDEEYQDVPRANETFPRNLALSFAPYDEFVHSMYGESNPADVPRTEKVMDVFGTDEPVEAGRTYGDIENGTARTFTAPPTVHTGMHRSTTAVGDTIEWVDRTIGESETDRSQGWYWATVGHVGTLLGLLFFTVGITGLLWQYTSRNESPPPGESGSEPAPRWVLAAASFLPALTIIPLYAIGVAAIPTTRVTHQELTHGYVVWIVGTVLVAAGVYQWRRGDIRPILRGLADRASAKSVGAGFAAVAVMYLIVGFIWLVPGSGARAWLAGIAPLPPLRLFSAVVYAPVFLLGTIALSAALTGESRSQSVGRAVLWRGVGRNLLLTTGGLFGLLAVFYLPLFAGFGLVVPPLGPLTTQIMRSTLLLVFATILITGVTNATRKPLLAGIVAGLFVTWVVVATGPIHVAPF